MDILSEVKPKDEFTIFGEYVSNELRLLSKLPDIQLRLKCDIQQLIVNANYRSLSRQYEVAISTSEIKNTTTPPLSSKSSTCTSGDQESQTNCENEQNLQESRLTQFLRIGKSNSSQDHPPS